MATNMKMTQYSDRKTLRESKIMNLASNINYFQNINSSKDIDKQSLQHVACDFLVVKDNKSGNDNIMPQ